MRRASATAPPAPWSRAVRWLGTLIVVVVGVALWGVFAFWAHAWLIGVAPLGR